MGSLRHTGPSSTTGSLHLYSPGRNAPHVVANIPLSESPSLWLRQKRCYVAALSDKDDISGHNFCSQSDVVHDRY